MPPAPVHENYDSALAGRGRDEAGGEPPDAPPLALGGQLTSRDRRDGPNAPRGELDAGAFAASAKAERRR